MKFLHEFRDPKTIITLIENVNVTTSHPWVIMEVCGGQTHSIIKYGLDQLLPSSIEIVHGPGCPVCVTPLNKIDIALEFAARENIIFTSFGDMLRVPGSNGTLHSVKALGGDIRVVYSPLDAIQLAKDNPDKEIVFFGIGFETTTPANAMSIKLASTLKLQNYSMLVSQVRVPPAIKAILSSPNNRVDGFLAAGHVCTVMGYWEYIPITEEYHKPIVVTGFEPVDILRGIWKLIQNLENNITITENEYKRYVTLEGNVSAQQVINEVFTPCDMDWRGIGTIPESGWKIADRYSDYDAEIKFDTESIIFKQEENLDCIAGEILQGLTKPVDCSMFRVVCSPDNPLGATMVSAEGACAAYYKYGK